MNARIVCDGMKLSTNSECDVGSAFALSPPKRNEGFTLIEILFTLLIAGASFSVILALQNSVVSSVIRSSDQLEASLITRDFFSAFEVSQQSELAPEVQDFQGFSPLEALEEVLETMSEDLRRSLRSKERFQLSLVSQPIAVPGLGGDVARRLELTVAWGDTGREQITTSYIVANVEALPIRQGS